MEEARNSTGLSNLKRKNPLNLMSSKSAWLNCRMALTRVKKVERNERID